MYKLIDSIYVGILKEYKNSSDISILTGSSGKILFLAYLYNSTKKLSVLRDLEKMIDHTIGLITCQNPNQLNFTYGGGITGFYWVINHLYRNKILFKDSTALKEILAKEIDDRIAHAMRQDFSVSKYDPLYGYIGKGLYFIGKPETKISIGIIKEILDVLVRDKTRIGSDMITWIDVRYKYDKGERDNERIILADCGQAHGVTGILSFLCAIINKFKSDTIRNIATSLLRPATDWLLSQETPLEKGGSFMYPYTVNLLGNKSNLKNTGRLGWCYGDTIVAYTLYKISAILNDDKYRKRADNIVLNSFRIPFEDSGVFDLNHEKIFNPTLCHGAAGIALIYKQIYFYNKSDQVLEALNFWRGVTQSYTITYVNTKGLPSLFEEGKEAYDFLYGYSGIGLYLISDIYSKSGWETSLLID